MTGECLFGTPAEIPQDSPLPVFQHRGSKLLHERVILSGEGVARGSESMLETHPTGADCRRAVAALGSLATPPTAPINLPWRSPTTTAGGMLQNREDGDQGSPRHPPGSGRAGRGGTGATDGGDDARPASGGHGPAAASSSRASSY